MSLLPPPRNAVLGAMLAALLFADLSAEASLNTMAGEHSLFGPLIGDQIRPGVSLTPGGSATGGFVVWQDNVLGPSTTVMARFLPGR